MASTPDALTRLRFLAMTEPGLRHGEERKGRGNPDIFKSVEYTYLPYKASRFILYFSVWFPCIASICS